MTDYDGNGEFEPTGAPHQGRPYTQWLAAGVAIFVAGWMGFQLYEYYQYSAKIDRITAGEVRGNKKSFIYHIPTCPQYNSIAPANIRSFATMEEAEDANYRPAANCDDDALMIRRLNETECAADGDYAYEDPRQ